MKSYFPTNCRLYRALLDYPILEWKYEFMGHTGYIDVICPGHPTCNDQPLELLEEIRNHS